MDHQFPDAAVDRFWSKVECREADECWPWLAMTEKDGYGIFRHMYRNYRSHRFAYLVSCGEIPEGMVVMHSCDKPGCCNPAHLSVGTVAENNHDRNRKGRTVSGDRHFRRLFPELVARGEQINTARLTEADVRVILDRMAAGAGNSELAREYGITPTAVRFIRIGRNWKHVDRPVELERAS